MRELMMSAVLLSVLLVSCEKKQVELEAEMIEVSFKASSYELGFETDMKSVPGYPDIPHRTDINLYSGTIRLGNLSGGSDIEFNFERGEFDNANVLLEAGNYFISSAQFSDIFLPRWDNRFWTEVYQYYGGAIISNTPDPDTVVYAISNENSQIDFEIVASQNCYVFRDPDGLLAEVTAEGNTPSNGILKLDMNIIDYDGETFYYFYSYNTNLWVYTTNGGHLELNIRDYFDSLDEADQFVYTGTWADPVMHPFTVYTTITDGGTVGTNAVFEISAHLNSEVEITLE